MTRSIYEVDKVMQLQNVSKMHFNWYSKKHLKNVGPIRHCEPPHAHSADVASGTVARRLRIDVHDDIDNDNAWQRDRYGPMEWAQKGFSYF